MRDSDLSRSVGKSHSKGQWGLRDNKCAQLDLPSLALRETSHTAYELYSSQKLRQQTDPAQTGVNKKKKETFALFKENLEAHLCSIMLFVQYAFNQFRFFCQSNNVGH